MEDYRGILGFDNIYDESHKYFSPLLNKLNIKDIHMIACGAGYPLILLDNEKKYQLSGSDISSEAIKIAKYRYPHLKFSIKDMRDFSLEEGMDLIFSLDGCINHVFSIKEVRNIFDSVYQNLKMKGFFYFELWTEDELSNDNPSSISKSKKIGELTVIQNERRYGEKIHNMMTKIEKDGEIVEILNAYRTCFDYNLVKKKLYEAGFNKVVELTGNDNFTKRILAFKY